MSSVGIDLSRYTCSRLPRTLWRVQHNESRASFQQNGNLVAELPNFTPETEGAFRQSLYDHLQWGYRALSSLFLSVFDDRSEAIRWAKARYRWHDAQPGGPAGAHVYKIDCSPSHGTVIFQVNELLPMLHIALGRDTSHEYLILHQATGEQIGLDVDIRNWLAQEERSGCLTCKPPCARICIQHADQPCRLGS